MFAALTSTLSFSLSAPDTTSELHTPSICCTSICQTAQILWESDHLQARNASVVLLICRHKPEYG